MISYYQLKKIGKKVGEAQILGQSCQKLEKLRKFCKKKVGVAQKLSQCCQKWEKLRKFGKKLVLYAFWPKKIHTKI